MAWHYWSHCDRWWRWDDQFVTHRINIFVLHKSLIPVNPDYVLRIFRVDGNDNDEHLTQLSKFDSDANEVSPFSPILLPVIFLCLILRIACLEHSYEVKRVCLTSI
ncbi:unnamed protein product [Nippostrongylus brasiliensis]|uniref:Malectin_like domain-containing protein n=1 Tax=Nippostrongylus brasiliensis TaxID=27835 RepID=A0A0N4XSD6_NIPBR|nr:unnamed protein product [Nippostrongylus brasiliensis]